MIHNVQVDTVVGLAVATVGSVYLIKTTVRPTCRCHNGDSLSARTTVVSVCLGEATVVSKSMVVCLQVIVERRLKTPTPSRRETHRRGTFLTPFIWVVDKSALSESGSNKRGMKLKFATSAMRLLEIRIQPIKLR